MKKIPTIFKRNPEKMSEILNVPHPECDWVFKGEGVATRKYDGTCVMIEYGKYFKRREVKEGKKIPSNFTEIEYDRETKKRVGWVPVNWNDKGDKWHIEAFFYPFLLDGTYELCGPKIQGNPENFKTHILISHIDDTERWENVPRDFDGIKEWLRGKDIE